MAVKSARTDNRAVLILLVIAVLLRVYHLGFPFAGHLAHKEVMHAGEAEFLLKDGGFLDFRNYFGEKTSDYYGELPTYVTYLMFRLFGVHEWAARLPVFFGGIAAVYVFYLLLLELYGSREAFFGAFLFAVAPMSVYFSRLLLEDAYTMPLILLAMLFFVRWSKQGKLSSLLWMALPLSLAIHVKIVSAYVVPVMLLYLWAGRKGMLKKAWLWVALGSSVAAPLLWKVLAYGSLKIPPHAQAINLGVLFQASFYVNMLMIWGVYFSPLVLLLFAAGLCFVSKEPGRHVFFLLWFLAGLGFLVATVPFSMMHAYYSLAVLPAICAIASASVKMGLVRRRWKTALGIVLLSTLPFTYLLYSIEYPYVAVGEYVRGNTNASESAIMEPPAAYYAKRFGVGYPSTVDDLRRFEGEYNLTYITLPGHIKSIYETPELKAYLAGNYHLEAVIYGKPNLVGYRLNATGEKYGYLPSVNKEPERVEILRKNEQPMHEG